MRRALVRGDRLSPNFIYFLDIDLISDDVSFVYNRFSFPQVHGTHDGTTTVDSNKRLHFNRCTTTMILLILAALTYQMKHIKCVLIE